MTPEQLLHICPNCRNAEALAPAIIAAVTKWGVKDLAMFVAQLAHESGEFRYVREIASGEAYEGRTDLGNDEAGDGPRYKGRGYLQITGKSNYRQCGKALGIDLIRQPELLESLPWSLESACWYWTSRKIDGLDLEAATRRINGGLNGLAYRERYYTRAIAALTPERAPVEDALIRPVGDAKIMSPFLLPALQAISELVPALANTLFNKDKSVPERNVEAATQIIEVAKKAAEASNEQELVEKIRSDPTAMKMVREAVTPLAALVEAGGGGIAGAREYSLKAADIPLYKQAAFVVALLLLPMIYGVVGFVMYSEAFDSNIKSFVVGVVVGSTLGAIVAHFLGSSTGSKTKTDAMIERARFGNV